MTDHSPYRGAAESPSNAANSRSPDAGTDGRAEPRGRAGTEAQTGREPDDADQSFHDRLVEKSWLTEEATVGPAGGLGNPER